MRNRFLARFAMSFFVIAIVLAWEAYTGLNRHTAEWRVALDLFAAAASISLGFAGMRERHRRQP
jgi:hypothetical protein